MSERRIQTVCNIASKRGLDLPRGWENDPAFCEAVIDKLEDDPRRNPSAKIAGFLNAVTHHVKDEATAHDLAQEYGLPDSFATTMHTYALGQFGYVEAGEGTTDLQELNRSLAEDAAY